MARGQTQLDALDEAAKTTPELEANLRGLEERAKGLRERKANVQAQLNLERHDIEKLESIVRNWIENSP